jgi:hypothetical protein
MIDYEHEFYKSVDYDYKKKKDCWISKGLTTGEGYITVRINVNGKTNYISAHRLSYLAFNGEIPGGLCVMHKCDNRACVNPQHLAVGTKQDNTQDMVNKGRVNRQEDRNGKLRKLTDDQIRSIRQSELSSYELANIYPVSATHIRRIRNGSRCSKVE